MNDERRSFDWPAFVVRVAVIVVITIYLLLEMMREHNRAASIVVIVVGFIVLPSAAYVHTRYYNTKFMRRIVEMVRQRIRRAHPN